MVVADGDDVVVVARVFVTAVIDPTSITAMSLLQRTHYRHYC